MKTLNSAVGIAAVLLSCAPGQLIAAEQPSPGSVEPMAPAVRMRSSSSFQSSPDGSENALISVDDSGAQSMDQTHERLKDPAQRARLRAEHRAMLRKQYPDMAEALGIDAQTEAKLFELMTDEHIAKLEQFANRDFESGMQEQADAETRRLTALRETLGAEGLENYRHYLATAGERAQVAQLDALMDPSDKLQPEQKRKLLELYVEQRRRETDDRPVRGWSVRSFQQMPSREELQRQSQLLTIGANEYALRGMQAWHPELERRAAEFLTPAQLAVLTRENHQQAARLKSWIENERREAGLDPAIPQHPDPSLAPPQDERVAIRGLVAYEVDVSVNGAKRNITHTGENGKPFEIRASEELWIRATPTLFEDHWMDVRLDYLEQTPQGKRVLKEKSGFGSLLMLPDGTPSRGGMTTDVIAGQKGYAVQLVMNARPLQ